MCGLNTPLDPSGQNKKENLCKLSHRPTKWHQMHLSHSYTQTHSIAVGIDGFENGPTTTMPEHSVGQAIERTDEHQQEENTNDRVKGNELGWVVETDYTKQQ